MYDRLGYISIPYRSFPALSFVFSSHRWCRSISVNVFSLSTGQTQSSMMPFTLLELVTLSRCLRDACLGIIKLAYPKTKAEHREEYMAAFRSVGVKTNTEVQQHIQAEQKRWVQLFKVRCVVLYIYYSIFVCLFCISHYVQVKLLSSSFSEHKNI